MSQKIFFALISGFIAGVWIRSFASFGWPFVSLLLLLAGILFFVYKLKRENLALILVVVFLGLSLGVARLELNQGGRDYFLDQYVDQEVTMEGIVVDERDERENHAKLTFLPDKISGQKIKNRGRILAISEHYPEFNYGDRISVNGKLSKVTNFNTGDSRDFDYVAFLAKDRIFYQMFYPELDLVDRGEGNFIKRTLISLKNKFIRNIKRVIPEPAASLAGGLIFGAKESMGEELLEDFRKTGLIHIVVLSGYNVTVVADAIMKSLSFVFRRGVALSFGVLGIILFAIMTGAGPTIVRASIMAILAVIARGTGRRYEITIALLVAAFLMVAQNPNILVFDVGFQLSFIATLGLIYLAPIVERKLKFVTLLSLPFTEILSP